MLMDIRQKATPRTVLRFADIIAHRGAFTGNLANLRHWSFLKGNFGRGSLSKRPNQDKHKYQHTEP
jgi:hypothetical protein